jgi:integrase
VARRAPGGPRHGRARSGSRASGGAQHRRLDSGVSPASVAKSYRLVRAIMNTGVEDGIVRRNPCRVRGASQDRSPERPVLTVREVVGLVEAIGERYRALVLLAVFGSLRLGELAALRRRDVDLKLGTVRVERSLSELPGGGYLFGPPMSAAGRRVAFLPAAIKPALADHLAVFTVDHPDALVFTSPAGMPMRPSSFRRRVWYPALAEAGLPGIHFHDLCHTGNAFTATTGATLRELMDRMGHSSTRAALIYLHGGDDRQRAIADDLSKLAQQELRRQKPRSPKQARGERSGTWRTRKTGNG